MKYFLLIEEEICVWFIYELFWNRSNKFSTIEEDLKPFLRREAALWTCSLVIVIVIVHSVSQSIVQTKIRNGGYSLIHFYVLLISIALQQKFYEIPRILLSLWNTKYSPLFFSTYLNFSFDVKCRPLVLKFLYIFLSVRLSVLYLFVW